MPVMTNTPSYAQDVMIGTQTLHSFLDEIRMQPDWRSGADQAADYYDDKQVTPELAAVTEARGQPLLVHNLIKPAINGILGLEAKTRPGIKLVADDDSGEDLVKALGQELNDAARLARCDRACSDAYAAMIKTGVGWVEVAINKDPFMPPFECNYIHRREIWWDWHSTRPDLLDARWQMRKKWIDQDVFKLKFKKHAGLVDQISCGWEGWDQFGEELTLNNSPNLVAAYSTYLNNVNNENEWWDSKRRRALIYEVYYRVWESKLVLKTSTGGVYVFDKKNPLHVAAAQSGKASLEMADFTRVRLAYFFGPFLLSDGPSPHPHNYFPYVPFFGYKEDRTGIPYGIVRSMIPAQDEINHRRSKLTWLLNIKRVTMDDDALYNMSVDELVDELHKGDAVVVLNKDRKRDNAFRVENETGIASQQFQVLQESQKLIQDVAGVYSAFLGQESGAKSGIAINSLVEQGTVTLSEINDNLIFARSLVHELLLAHVVTKIGNTKKAVRVKDRAARTDVTIVLNERTEDQYGNPIINNNVQQARARVVVQDVPATAGYRQQMNLMLADMVSKMPPEFQAVLIEMVVDSSDLDNREEVIERIQKITGGDMANASPEERQAAMQQQQQQRQEEEMLKSLELESIKAKVEKDVAEAQAKIAEVKAIEQNTTLDAELKVVEIRKREAEIKQIVNNIVIARHGVVNKYVNGELDKMSA